MERPKPCKNRGECIGAATALLDWPIYLCTVQGSISGTATNGDVYCRAANNEYMQVTCDKYEEDDGTPTTRP